MGLSDETFEMVSNSSDDGHKMQAAAQRHKQGKQAANQKYNPAGTLQGLAERHMTTKGATQSAMGAHAQKQAGETTFRRKTVVTKDEPYQPGM